MTASRLTRGYLIAFAATLIWSSSGVFIRYLSLQYQLPALVLAFWRDLIIAIALALGLVLFRRSLLRSGYGNGYFFAFYGLVLALFNSLWTLSVTLNGAAAATVMAYSSAAFTAILGWWLLHEALGWGKLGVVTLSMFGCILVAGAFTPEAWQLNPLGILTGLISGLMFAAYSLMGRSASLRGIPPLTSLVYTFAWASFFLLAFNLAADIAGGVPPFSRLLWLQNNVPAWLILLALALGPTLGGFGLYTLSLVDLPASIANLISTLEPIFTALIAYVVLAELLTPVQLLGGALILCSVVLLRILEARRPPAVDIK